MQAVYQEVLVRRGRDYESLMGRQAATMSADTNTRTSHAITCAGNTHTTKNTIGHRSRSGSPAVHHYQALPLQYDALAAAARFQAQGAALEASRAQCALMGVVVRREEMRQQLALTRLHNFYKVGFSTSISESVARDPRTYAASAKKMRCGTAWHACFCCRPELRSSPAFSPGCNHTYSSGIDGMEVSLCLQDVRTSTNNNTWPPEQHPGTAPSGATRTQMPTTATAADVHVDFFSDSRQIKTPKSQVCHTLRVLSGRSLQLCTHKCISRVCIVHCKL